MTLLFAVMLQKENEPHLWLSFLSIRFSLHVNVTTFPSAPVFKAFPSSLVPFSLFTCFGHFPSFTIFQVFTEK